MRAGEIADKPLRVRRLAPARQAMMRHPEAEIVIHAEVDGARTPALHNLVPREAPGAVARGQRHNHVWLDRKFRRSHVLVVGEQAHAGLGMRLAQRARHMVGQEDRTVGGRTDGHAGRAFAPAGPVAGFHGHAAFTGPARQVVGGKSNRQVAQAGIRRAELMGGPLTVHQPVVFRMTGKLALVLGNDLLVDMVKLQIETGAEPVPQGPFAVRRGPILLIADAADVAIDEIGRLEHIDPDGRPRLLRDALPVLEGEEPAATEAVKTIPYGMPSCRRRTSQQQQAPRVRTQQVFIPAERIGGIEGLANLP